jgi:hypothetical protein
MRRVSGKPRFDLTRLVFSLIRTAIVSRRRIDADSGRHRQHDGPTVLVGGCVSPSAGNDDTVASFGYCPTLGQRLTCRLRGRPVRRLGQFSACHRL